ncbi:MAG: phosphoribosylanthranilate isomerase [Blautia sp.]|nr:phosphoribosylanthranilate isomerase [Blautia sp.]
MRKAAENSSIRKKKGHTRPLVKMCGLSRPEDILAVNEAKPDFAGFILGYQKSFRNIPEETLAVLTSLLDEEILPVGVFVDAPLEVPERLLKKGILKLAQLHGEEDEDYIRSLQERTGRPVIKAFTVRNAGDIQRALKSSADYILLDQGKGGGQVFDWSLIPPIERRFFLAGGLGTDNIEEAVRKVHPWALDLSSGLETGKKKDPEKIRRIMEILDAAEKRIQG